MVLVVITSATDCLERLVSKMTYYVSSGTYLLTYVVNHRRICIHVHGCVQDVFFYSLVYDNQQKSLIADHGEIRVGLRYQVEIIPDKLESRMYFYCYFYFNTPL